MYHPGRAVEVFSSDGKNVISSDNTVQVLLEMWDDNLITVQIDPSLVKSAKKGDVLIVDYTNTQTGPKMAATKILRGDVSKRVWEKYRDFYEKKKSQQSMPAKARREQHYVG